MPAPDSDVSDPVASDTVRKAVALGDRMVQIGEAGNLQEAIALCDEMTTRFGTDALDGRIRYQVAHALRNKVRCLNRLGRTDEAAKLCAEIAVAYSADEYEAIREIAATTASWAAVAAYERDDLDETITICEEYVADLVDDASRAVREQAILMLGLKASTLALSVGAPLCFYRSGTSVRILLTSRSTPSAQACLMRRARRSSPGRNKSRPPSSTPRTGPIYTSTARWCGMSGPRSPQPWASTRA